MEEFKECKAISKLLGQNKQLDARNQLIKLLYFLNDSNIEYSELVNHLIRETGLFPYMRTTNAIWQDQLVYEIFKVDIGKKEPVTLHREQSKILKKLLDGKDIAVSAPTSFGKSFIIDAFISIKQPKNVVIIVPTIALSDETRRRIQKKFAKDYKIITTPDVELAQRNILIFPQERALNYLDKLDVIDILIIDEFYKASTEFDKERAPILINAIFKLTEKARQRYFLAPNIKTLEANPITKDMEFLYLDFNTVFTQRFDFSNETKTDDDKGRKLLEILKGEKSKALIYAGSYANITAISALLKAKLPIIESPLLNSFSDWLAKNYEQTWDLTGLVKRETGIHNGRLHRSLSQIQVKLFEEPNGLANLVSTSSIIEGVNTSTEKVILWSNKNGRPLLDDFTYKNIVGRSGRMFKHFIGKVYLLAKPPVQKDTQLTFPFTDEVLMNMDASKMKGDLSKEQLGQMIAFKQKMYALVGKEEYEEILKTNSLRTNDSDLILKLAASIKNDPNSWNGLSFLNSPLTKNWDSMLFKAIEWMGYLGITHTYFVRFVQILSEGWKKSIPQLLLELRQFEIGIDRFFELERMVTFNLATILNDINVLHKAIHRGKSDISSFISKVSHAFLPAIVYQLEEYGLPRMISRKIHTSHILDLENANLTIHDAIDVFNEIGKKELVIGIKELHPFEHYVIDYFYDGISSDID